MQPKFLFNFLIFAITCKGVTSTLVVTPVNVAVRQGSAVRLQCSSDDSDSAIQWYNSLCVTSTDIAQCKDDFIYNGFVLVGDRPSFSVTEGDNAAHVTRDLNINPTQLTDAGVYLCAEQVPGVAGVTHSSAQLIVLGESQLSTDVSDLQENDTVTMTCSVTHSGNWAPVMRWSASKSSRTFTDDDITSTTNDMTVTSQLTFRASADLHGSKIVCETYFMPTSTPLSTSATNVPSYTNSSTSPTLNILASAGPPTSPPECDCLSSVWCWLAALIAVSSVEAGVCIIALVLVIIICKGKVYERQRELALCIAPEILIWVLAAALIVISAIFYEKIRNDAELMDCGVLDDANLEALLITSLVLFANVVIIITIIICISVVYRREDGKLWTWILAVIVLLVAMLCSAAAAIWSVIAGEEIKDTCATYAGKWTWQILLIAFLASVAAGIFVIVIVVFTCVNRAGGNLTQTDNVELKSQDNNAVEGNGQDDSNKTGARKNRTAAPENGANGYENVALDD